MEEQSQQKLAGLGYINEDEAHILISIKNPSLAIVDGREFAHVAITVKTAVGLRDTLSEFLRVHWLGRQ